MDGNLLRRFADLAVGVGANVQPGQIVAIHAEPAQRPFVLELVESAYRRGALFVDVWYFDPEVKRRRLLHAGDASVGYVPPWYGQRALALGEHGAARISIAPSVPPGTLADVDPERAGRDSLPSLKETLEVVNTRKGTWTIVPYPTAPWAAVVHPELEPEAALARLWEEVVHVLRLDEPDAESAWRQRFAALQDAAARVTERHFDALHFKGPGTDLSVGLLPTSRFDGGAMTNLAGIEHGPNLPTEEIASAPDPQRVDGVVRATKPLDVAGSVVRGLRVRFEGGRAVEIDADENAEVLRARCARDDGASRLGEVALVDREGRVGPLDTVFFNTLLDENAASHIAFGNAYEISVAKDDLPRINRSAIHLDFMVGGDDVRVTGVTRSDERVPVLVDGTWQV